MRRMSFLIVWLLSLIALIIIIIIILGIVSSLLFITSVSCMISSGDVDIYNWMICSCYWKNSSIFNFVTLHIKYFRHYFKNHIFPLQMSHLHTCIYLHLTDST